MRLQERTDERMAREGFLERGGRPRRIVRVTPGGLAVLRKSRAALLDLWDGLEEALDAG